MNGQAKIDFEKWYNETIGKEINVGHLSLYTLSSTMINSVKIEWFDSVGIIIKNEYRHRHGFNYSISYKTNDFNPYALIKGNLYCIWSRQKATEKAIEKATELYNLKFKQNE